MSAGVLAGALAAYHREAGTEAWKAWLPVARAISVVYEGYEGEQ